MSFTSGYATCAGREIHYTDWGQPQRGTVIAWHGLARTGRDMDELAEHLAGQGWRVVCPDTLGRGFSEWARNPADEYCLAFYARLARELIDQLGIERLHWVGTSMGGAIGTVCASGLFEPSLKSRILSLVLNDNAPELAQPAIERIKAYAGNPPGFDRMADLEAFFRQVYKPFGWLSDAQWRRLTETSARRLPDGRWTPHYDPAMVQQFIHHPDDYRIWEHYDLLRFPCCACAAPSPTWCCHRPPRPCRPAGPVRRGMARIVEVAGCGHAPALNVPGQLHLIASFLQEHP
jgi:pimeloyl-ACP methyl ester carboxylesterase